MLMVNVASVHVRAIPDLFGTFGAAAAWKRFHRWPGGWHLPVRRPLVGRSCAFG